MKHARIVFFLGAFALILITGCSSTMEKAQWKEVVPQTVFAEKLRIAVFLDENFGLNGGAGDVGKARYTLDGGKTWTQVDTSGG